MSISNVNSNPSTQTYTSSTQSQPKTSEQTTTTVNTSVQADKVETTNSTNSNSNYKQDINAVKKAIQEAESKYSSMQNLVEKLLTKQGKTGLEANWDFLSKNGKLGDVLKNIKVDEETKLKAQQDVSEDGYYGVKKTSERIVNFAKALTGGDPSKADKMLEAFKKGYQAAVGAFGGKDKMPKISQDTYDAVVKGFEEWKNGKDTIESDMENVANKEILNQGATGNITK